MIDALRKTYVARRLDAWWRDVPFRVDDLWLPYWTTFNVDGNRYDDEFKVRAFSEPASIGDRAGLLQRGDEVYVYEVTSRRRSSGSDHIASPYRYDFVYCGALDVEAFEAHQEALRAERAEEGPRLLSLWS